MKPNPVQSENQFGLAWGMDVMRLPCHGTAYFDEQSGISYRCADCGAVVGSVGMPQVCQIEAQKWELQKALGGTGWDYWSEEI